jgi:hypothetical protein
MSGLATRAFARSRSTSIGCRPSSDAASGAQRRQFRR